MRIRRRRPDHQHRVHVDGATHGRDIGPQIIADRHPYQLESEIVGGFVEGRMRRRGQDDLRLLDLGPGRSSPFAGGQHRHQDALGAAGGHVAGRGSLAAQQVAHHRDDLGFEAPQAGEGGRVKAVLGEEHPVGVLEQSRHVVVGLEYQAEDATVAPIDVSAAGSLHLGQDDFL